MSNLFVLFVYWMDDNLKQTVKGMDDVIDQILQGISDSFASRNSQFFLFISCINI